MQSRSGKSITSAVALRLAGQVARQGRAVPRATSFRAVPQDHRTFDTVRFSISIFARRSSPSPSAPYGAVGFLDMIRNLPAFTCNDVRSR